MRIRKQVNKNFELYIFGVLLIMPIIIQFLSVLINNLSSTLTMFLYGGVLIYTFIKNRYYRVTDMLGLLFIYLIFIANYYLFPDSRVHLVSKEMMIIYFFFLPLCIFIVKNIESWEGYERILFPYSVIAILIGTLIVFVFKESELSYMEFSYGLLPFLNILYTNYRTHKYSNKKVLILFILGVIDIVAFGARGPILFVAIYIVFFEVFRVDINRNRKIIIICMGSICLLLLTVFSDAILEYLGQLPMFKDSYFFWNLRSGDFFGSNSRAHITEQSIKRISTMGIEFSGLFGDRLYCGGIYPHNFILEILMSLGWIMGSAVLITLFITIIIAFVRKEQRILVLFLITSLFLRYLISGSYLIEGKFWIFIFALISLRKVARKRNKEVIL